MTDQRICFRCIDETGKDQIWKAAVKANGSIKNGISINEETEEEISFENVKSSIRDLSKCYSFWPKKIQIALIRSKDQPFVIFGDFISVRSHVLYHGFLIEADDCTYPNGTKLYELEVETENVKEAQKVICQKLQDNGISFQESTIGKRRILLRFPKDQWMSEKLKNFFEQIQLK